MLNINIVIFNHISPATNDSRGIADQVDFVTKYLQENNRIFTVSYLFDPHSLNIVIEGFNEDTAQTITDFCQRYDKMVLVIMTEHLILGGDGRLKFGVYNSNSKDYIGNIAQRIYSLMSISEYVLGYVTLGELPELESLEKVLSVSHVYRLDYPLIKAVDKNLPNTSTESRSDLVFTGFLTNFRSKVINSLSEKYDVQFFELVDDDMRRKRNLLSGKVALNIPQTDDWPWVSPMRVIYCLSNGIPCVHIGKGDGTEFYKRVLSWVTIDEVLESPDSVLERQIAAYNDIELEAGRFLSLISVWEIMETDQGY